jgi:hypothetical protein
MPLRLSLLAGCVAALVAGRAGAQSSEGVEFFERKIRPLLVEHCHKCHGTEKPKAGLRLDSRAGVLKGGDNGPALVPGEPAKSLLLKAVGYEDPDLRMPPRGKLPEELVADLRRWVSLGAPWPDDASNQKLAVAKEFDLQARSRHWSLQPLTRPPLPMLKNPAWVQTPIDVFILAKLEEKGLTPAPPADAYTLLRRLCFDLIGLPPTIEEVREFARLAEGSAKPQAAIEQIVDRLLASPHYGERWGRHWLDLVRYAETMGHEFDYEIPEAWRYRDYVIRAFNQDVPYRQLVIEHIAGDLLAQPRRHPVHRSNESILGTGFWWLGEGKHSPVDSRADQADRIDNQIDVFGKTFLGLTIACARCHDHKFDAISTKDYYALAGYLQSSRQDRAFLDDPGPRRAALAKLDKLRGEIRDLIPDDECAVAAAERDAGALFPFPRAGWGAWFVTGEAFGDRPSQAGDFVSQPGVVVEAIRMAEPGWAHSGLRSLKLQGSLRSPTFVIQKRYLHYRLAGRDARVQVILNGLQFIRDPIYGSLGVPVKDETPHWRTQDLGMWQGQRAYIEVLDDGPGYVALEQVVASDDPQPPQSSRHTPCAVAWADGARSAPATIAPLLPELRKLEAALPAPTRGLAAADGSGVDECVFIRGSSKNLGPVVPRRFLEVFGGDRVPAPEQGSGRLELARQLVDPARTPILPRVIVNRIWKHHFGEGIVRSPDDFGLLGQAPTHPELLDYLASEFVKGGWSLKKLHRMIVLSATYRQSSAIADFGLRIADSKLNPQSAIHNPQSLDPDNKLLHKMPIRRLEAETVRDALLAVSGRLDRTVGGPSVPVHLTPFMLGRGRPGVSGPLDGAGRRSLYLSVRRNFLTPMLVAFDYPTPFSTIGRRSVSNVPAQALTMLNNPLVLQQAQQWAQRTLADAKLTSAERIERMYLAGLGRPPSPRELAEALAFVRDRDASAWTELAHVLFNVKEFIFVQ